MKFLMDLDFSECRAHAWRVEQGVIECEQPLIKQDKPWDSGVAGSEDMVMYDEEEGLWKTWYTAGERTAGIDEWVLAYAESDDGLVWRKPELDICQWKGHTGTNILITPEIGGGVILPSVIKNPDVDGPKRWELYVFLILGPNSDGTVKGLRPPESLGHHPRHWGLYRFFSPDGLHWTISDGPMFFWDGPETMPAFVFDPRYRADGAYVHKRSDGAYVMFQKLPLLHAARTTRSVCGWGSIVRTWGRSTSEDGLHWSPPVLLLAPDDRDPGDLCMIDLSVALGDNRHLGVVGLMHSNEASVDLGFTAGTDDNTPWFRPGRRPCLHNPPLGDPGGGQLRACHHPIERDGEIHVYHSAYDGLHGNPENPAKDFKTQWDEWRYFGGTGRAVWEADRLWAIGPFGGAAFPANVTTVPQDNVAGKELVINGRAIGDGVLTAELIDGAGNAIEGYALADNAPLRGDDHGFVMKWKAGSVAPADGISVRFDLRRAWLYSFEWR